MTDLERARLNVAQLRSHIDWILGPRPPLSMIWMNDAQRRSEAQQVEVELHYAELKLAQIEAAQPDAELDRLCA